MNASTANAVPMKEGTVQEEARNIPIADRYDVVVSGAGPAGWSAAIEAGRNGAKTLLLEVNGQLGGVWTSGLLSWILDQANKPGLMRELISRLDQLDARCPIDTGNSLAFDVEKMKLLLETMCMEANVDVLLHSRVVAAIKDKSKRLTHVVTESKSGRQAWQGKIFIDTTGDGDLAALSGCGYDFGNPDDGGSHQPMSLLAVVSGIQFEEIEKFVRRADDKGSISKKYLLEEIVKSGVLPSYLKPGLYPIDKDLYMLMANQEYEFSGFNVKEVTKATLHARRELHEIINGLKSLQGPWSNIRIVQTADQIGVREARRIHGLYTVTQDDLVNGARHKDAVCRVTFGVDVHSVKEVKDPNASYNHGIRSKPYDIPLRALIAKDVGGLLMAGRCISGDFIAHSSYRVTGNAAAMGEAAGRVGAIAALKNKLPQEVNI